MTTRITIHPLVLAAAPLAAGCGCGDDEAASTSTPGEAGEPATGGSRDRRSHPGHDPHRRAALLPTLPGRETSRLTRVPIQMTMRSPTRTVLLAATLALAAMAVALLSGPPSSSAAKAKQEKQPNIVVVMTDDQTVESMRVMPKAQRLLGRRGVTFTNSFASNPICCPSRATFMNGQYSHTNGVFRNDGANGGFSTLDAAETLPVWLQRAGYATAHVGKFLNGYGEGEGAAAVPPGWTEWYATEDPSTYRMYGYQLNENGTLNTYGDYDVPDPALYQTDLLAAKATDFINRRAPQEAPFFLSVAPLAPHVEVYRRDPGDDDPPTPNYPNPRPAPRHVGAFANENLPKKGAFNEANVNDKPEAIRNLPPLDGPATGQARNKYRSRLTSLLAVDDMVGSLVDSLRANGELNRTLIVFTSDNGFLLGEHRIRTGKQYPYEPSVRVPLLMRGPGIPKGEERDQLVANVDLAPTLADFGQATTGLPPDGRSVRRLIDDPDLEPGRAIVLENWCQTNEACFDPDIARYRGVRTNRFKYLEYPNGERELYDLDRDPDELKSLQDKAKYEDEEAALRRLFARLRDCSAGACRISPKLKLKLSFDRGRLGGGKRCTDSAVTATVGGRDKGSATDGTFSVPGEDRSDGKRPLRVRIPKRDLKGGRVTPVTAEVYVLQQFTRSVMGSPKTLMIYWRCKTFTCEGREGINLVKTSHRWRQYVDVNAQHLATRVTEGVATFRADELVSRGTLPDEYRQSLVHEVPKNFVREHVHVEATWGIYQRMIGAYREPDRAKGRQLMRNLIDALAHSVPAALTELITLGRTLKKRAEDVLAYFDRPGTSNGPTEAINGRLEHLRGSALGFRNLTNYIARSLLEAGGFRPRLHPRS